MKYHNKILIICWCIICFSCNKPPQPENIRHIKVEFEDKSIESSSFLNEHKEISLSTPSNDAVIGSIERLLFSKNKIFIMDRGGNKVLMFDEKGNFLKSTAKMVGKGHNEYLRVIDAAIDNKNQKLYVHCDAPYQIMVFDLDLNLERIISLDFYMTEIAIDKQFLYGICIDSKNDSGYELIAIDKKHLKEKPRTIYSCTNFVSGRMTLGKSLTSFKDKVYASLPFDNRICVIQNGEIKTEYKIDFGNKGLDEHPIKKGINPRWFDKQYEDINWSIVNICNSDSILIFRTNKATNFIINKSTGICKAYESKHYENVPFSNSHIIPSEGTQNTLIYSVDYSVIDYTLKYAKEKNITVDSSVYEFAHKLNPDGNPMLIVWDIK